MKRLRPTGFGFLLVLVLWACGARAADPVVTLSEPRRDVFEVEGRFETRAGTAAAWRTLTDYERIGEFVSSVDWSRVSGRQADYLLVEQISSHGIWFVRRDIEVLLKVRETPGRRIEFEDVGRQYFESYRGAWQIEPRGNATEVTYSLRVEAKSGLPSFVSRRVIRGNIARLLSEVAREIERLEGRP